MRRAINIKNMHENRKKLDLVLSCAVCTTVMEEKNVNVVAEQEMKTVFHALCPKCLTASLFFLSHTEKGLVSVGTATDLNREEAIKIFGQKAISTDEVIEVYRSMTEMKSEK